MKSLAWSSLPAGTPSFHVFRRDDAVIRTLQGSQVAVHEQRMAYENLLLLSSLERESWERQKTLLEDEVRVLGIRNREAERRMKELLSRLHAGLLDAEEALTKLSSEHDLLQQSSEETTSSLLQRVDDLQRTVAELQEESVALQSELVAVQADAALKDAAMAQVGQLETAMSALRERARQLVADLERDKASAERRAADLASDLSTAQQRLVREAQARASSETTAARLALERQQLAAALELERLINEPLRHTNYATTTTLTHVMRSPVAATVRDRAGQPQPRNSTAGVYIAPREVQPLQPQGNHDTERPRSAPPASDASTIADPSVSTATAGLPAQDSTASFAFSPQRAAALVTARNPGLGAAHPVTGRTLTRLGRSWATTTAAAGLPNPAYLDNLNSTLSPPAPGPQRRRTAVPTSTANIGSPNRRHSAQRSSGGASSAPAASTASARPTSLASNAAFAGETASPSSSSRGGAPPQHLTSMMRSPQTPVVEDSTGWFTTGGGLPTWIRSPGVDSGGMESPAARPYSPRVLGQVSGGWEAVTPPQIVGTGGKAAMRASIGRSAIVGSKPEGVTPATIVYG